LRLMLMASINAAMIPRSQERQRKGILASRQGSRE
jgi:hypothetical protein